VTPRVTLNLGLRYEPYLPWVEKRNDQTAVWRVGQQSQRSPGLPPNVLVGGDPGVPEAGHDKQYNRWDPRLGVAWLLPDDKTSVRAGFGIFHEFPGSIVNNRITLAPPFAVAINIQNPTSLTSPWTASQPNPYPTELPPPPSYQFPRPVASTVYGEGFTNADARHWNASVERQVTSTWLARVSYIGSQLRHLLANREINPAVLTDGATLSNINQRRPYYPNYSSVVQFESTGRSNYHAVAFSTERRLNHGYALSASYTWSQSKDNGGAVVAGGAGAFYTNPNNPDYDYGYSEFDRTHRFVGTFVWEIPGAQLTNGAVGNALLGVRRVRPITRRRGKRSPRPSGRPPARLEPLAGPTGAAVVQHSGVHAERGGHLRVGATRQRSRAGLRLARPVAGQDHRHGSRPHATAARGVQRAEPGEPEQPELDVVVQPVRTHQHGG
jgi:hypothetical protein